MPTDTILERDTIHDGSRADVALSSTGTSRFQGAWVANTTDSTEPTPTERYATDDVTSFA